MSLFMVTKTRGSWAFNPRPAELYYVARDRIYKGKGKGKICPRTGREGTQGE
jgi:hypothetical protein